MIAMAVTRMPRRLPRTRLGRWRALRPAALALGLSAGLWLVATAAWLVPTLAHRSSTAVAIAGFDSDQLTAFATAAGPLGAPLNVLTLQGFWGGARGFVALASSTGPWFLLACLLVAGLVTGGFVLALRRKTGPASAWRRRRL